MPRLVIDVERCKGCGLCVAVCPPEVLAMAQGLNSRGYHPVELVDEKHCTSCGACALMCPDVALIVFRPQRGAGGDEQRARSASVAKAPRSPGRIHSGRAKGQEVPA